MGDSATKGTDLSALDEALTAAEACGVSVESAANSRSAVLQRALEHGTDISALDEAIAEAAALGLYVDSAKSRREDLQRAMDALSKLEADADGLDVFALSDKIAEADRLGVDVTASQKIMQLVESNLDLAGDSTELPILCEAISCAQRCGIEVTTAIGKVCPLLKVVEQGTDASDLSKAMTAVEGLGSRGFDLQAPKTRLKFLQKAEGEFAMKVLKSAIAEVEHLAKLGHDATTARAMLKQKLAKLLVVYREQRERQAEQNISWFALASAIRDAQDLDIDTGDWGIDAIAPALGTLWMWEIVGGESLLAPDVLTELVAVKEAADMDSATLCMRKVEDVFVGSWLNDEGGDPWVKLEGEPGFIAARHHASGMLFVKDLGPANNTPAGAGIQATKAIRASTTTNATDEPSGSTSSPDVS